MSSTTNNKSLVTMTQMEMVDEIIRLRKAEVLSKERLESKITEVADLKRQESMCSMDLRRTVAEHNKLVDMFELEEEAHLKQSFETSRVRDLLIAAEKTIQLKHIAITCLQEQVAAHKKSAADKEDPFKCVVELSGIIQTQKTKIADLEKQVAEKTQWPQHRIVMSGEEDAVTISRLHGANENQAKAIKEYQKTITDQHQKIAELQQNHKGSIEKLETDKAFLCGQNHSLAMELTTVKNQLAQRHKVYDDQKAKIKEQEATIVELQVKLANSQNAEKKANLRFSQVGTANDMHLSDLNMTKAQLKKCEEDLKKATHSLGVTKIALSVERQLTESYGAKLKAAEAKIFSESLAKDKVIQSLEFSLQAADREASARDDNSQIQKLEEEFESCERHCAELATENFYLQEELTTASVQVVHMKSKIATVLNDAEYFKAKSQSLKKKVKVLKAEKKAIKKESKLLKKVSVHVHHEAGLYDNTPTMDWMSLYPSVFAQEASKDLNGSPS